MREALEIMRHSGSPAYEADVRCELAELARSKRDFPTALDEWARAESPYRDAGHPRAEEIHAKLEAFHVRASDTSDAP